VQQRHRADLLDLGGLEAQGLGDPDGDLDRLPAVAAGVAVARPSARASASRLARCCASRTASLRRAAEA
jgi:hypothetical protein